VTIARKATVLILLLACFAAPAAAAAPTPHERSLYADAPNGMYLLDRGWTTSSHRSKGFKPVAVPNAFNAHDLSRKSFGGRVQWYRARFRAPRVAGLAQWRVRFESVNVDATVWLNGVRLGRHRGAYLPFELPARLRTGDNELLVRVDSRGHPGDLPPANRPRGWWNFGGILREVYLRAVRSFDLTNVYVSAAPGAPATAHVTATLRNASAAALPGPTRIHVTGPSGFDASTTADPGVIQSGASALLDATMPIPDARLWTPGDPNLYKLTIAAPGGQRTVAHFGVRSWSVGSDGRLLLNGQPITLRGASFHEQVPARGAALTPADRNEIVRELHQLHANFAREHYPPHPALLEAFDRAGIVFWEQLPVWRVGAAQLAQPSFRRSALTALQQAILRDRNHPSILAWSISNETLRGGVGETAYIRAARDTVKRLDPTRLLAADKSLRPLDDLPSSYGLLDAIGLNEYIGWYGGKTSQLPADLATVHQRFPQQAIVITEFGAEANRGGPATRKGTYAFQQRFLSSHLGIFDSTPWLSGALVWVLRDFAVRPGWKGGNPRPQPPLLFKGLFRRDGSPKPAVATVRQSFDH
jgi:beta-glucuronidase